jgi:hypothetical protein
LLSPFPLLADPAAQSVGMDDRDEFVQALAELGRESDEPIPLGVTIDSRRRLLRRISFSISV